MALRATVGIPGLSARLATDTAKSARGSTRADRVPYPQGVTLLVSVPTEGFKDIERIEDDVRLLLDQIEGQHRVTIRTTDHGVTINGGTKNSVAAAVNQVYQVLKRRPNESKLWHPKILIDPRCWLEGDDDKLRFDIAKQADIGARPTSSSPNGNGIPVHSQFRENILQPYQEAFNAEVKAIVENLRYMSTEMRMRAVYGTFRLEEWKKDKVEYSREEFEQTTQKASRRGTCHMEKLIGNDKSAAKLLAQIMQSPDHFGPVNARVGDLTEVLPVHTLLLVLPGLEVEVEVLSIKSARGGKMQSWQLGPLCGYRRERRGRQVALITSSPHLPFDWYLEVKSRVPEDRLPFSHADLVSNLKMTTRAQENEFPEVDLNSLFSTMYNVDAVLAKTTSSFNMQESPYNIDISVYRKWGTNTLIQPVIGAGVEVYGDHWDEIMNTEELAGRPRDWEEDLSGFFPSDYNLDKKHLDAFFHYVRKTQDWLRDVLTETPAT